MTKSSQPFREQVESLYAMSVEVAALRDLPEIYDRALTCCLELTGSGMGFIDLINDDGVDMDVVAIKGFEPSDPRFFERFRRMPIRPSVFGVTITEQRSHISNDVSHDKYRVGTPPGHPPVRTFLGVPLRVGTTVIGMIGVANRFDGYHPDDERLLSTFANQVAVAIDNARLYERQRQMIERLQLLNRRLSESEREQLLSLERERIAAGLHDRIEQEVFTIGLRLNALLEHGVDEELAAQLQDIRHLASRTADEVHEVIFSLAVPGDGDGELTSSIRRLLRETGRTAGLETDLVVSGTPTAAVGSVGGILQAVINEALANVVKHSRARMVLVSIRYEPDRVDVVVQDDGVGVPELVLRSHEESEMHYGLRNMRQQIVALGGDFEVFNGDESGLTIRVSVPLPPGEHPA
jgi:signal transduction histidine kinase